jgi:hypothetical protein
MGRPHQLLACVAVMLALAACRGKTDSEAAPPAASLTPLAPTQGPTPAHGNNLGPPRIPAKCIRSLEQYCVTPPCPTYESALREAVEKWSLQPMEGACVSRQGECGPLRFVSAGDGYSTWTGFFDKSGRLVAGFRSTDVRAFCDRTSFTAFYGEPLTCDQIVTADYCKEPPR